MLRSFAGIKLAASEIRWADVDLTLKFWLKEVAIAVVDGVTNPSQTEGKASSTAVSIHDSLLFKVVIFVTITKGFGVLMIDEWCLVPGAWWWGARRV